VRTIRFQIIGLIILCSMIAACSEKTAPAGPRFKGRLLFLSGDEAAGKDLMELTAGPNDTFNYTTVTSGVFEAAPSPDQSQLLYTTKGEIQLLDSGIKVRLLIKGQGYCLAWAPDGKHFSYKQRSESSIKLFASNLEGNAKLVWEERLADKQPVSQSAAADVSGCAYWVAPDKLIFDTFGPSQKKGGDVKPNTTTVATVSDSVKLVDAEKKWSVEGLCKTGNAILRSQDQGKILIAKSLESLKTVNPTSGPCSGCRFVGFATQSCVPFFLEENTRDSSDLFSLNPTNWQRQRGAHIGQPFSLNAKMLINSSSRLMVVGDAPSFLLLVDTESGDITSLLAKTNAPLTSPVPIVWIEKN